MTTNKAEHERALSELPQYRRSIDNFYLWASGGSLKDKLREFAIRYQDGRQDGESEIFLDDMHNALADFIAKEVAAARDSALLETGLFLRCYFCHEVKNAGKMRHTYDDQTKPREHICSDCAAQFAPHKEHPASGGGEEL